MKLKTHTVLMITSFVPVIAFKVIARIGAATLSQARIAALVGLVLALIQYVLSKRLLQQTTYLERAFLAFLAAAALWLSIAPEWIAMLFVAHSITLLYIVLFLTTLLPQAFGYDPFTYAIAKQWYPQTVWNVPQFRTINLHITYLWSGVFLAATLSSFLGGAKPFFSILLPLLFVLGIGLPFSVRYPDHYLKRAFPAERVDPSLLPTTARELVSHMPSVFNPDAIPGLTASIQFFLSGEGGGDMVLSIANGQCTFREGDAPSPTLSIRSSAETWLKIARGELDRPKALMDGLFSVQGDMGLLMNMGNLFRPPMSSPKEPLTGKESPATQGGA